ncbi:MAG: TonB-dependent receptor plug domain-containing protein [Acidobacteria bacterium]|nr:TonB-dependent receptor plug domain-containing protein [Acidobacteriota bacterium]
MFNKIFRFGTILFALFFNAAIGTNAQNNTYKFSGSVKDINGRAIVGANIKIKQQGSNFERDANTNERGEFEFNSLEKVSYQLTVAAKSFTAQTQTIDIGRTNFLIITLQPENIAEYVSITSSYLAGTTEALERTAGSIETIDKDMLEKSRVFNFSEALRKVSGINIRDEEGFGLRPNIGIRGTNPTRSTKVLLLEDGIPLAYAPYGDNASYYHPPIERFESVEVLKGAGQIEYGPVTVAGVVNYITPNPPEKPGFSLKLLGGNRDYFNGNVGFGGTFGKTGVLFNFTRKRGAGARDNVRSGLNDFSSKIVQPINDKNVLTFKYSHYNENSQITYSGLTEAEYAENPRQNPFLNDSFNLFREGLSVSHIFVFTPKTSLTTNAYTSYFSRDWWRQSSNSGERPNRRGNDPDCRGMQDLLTTCGNQGRLRDYRIYGIEPRFNMQFDLGEIRNDLNIGFRIHHENQDRRQKNGDLPTSRDGILVESNVRRNLAVSGFIQNRFIWRNFSFTPGLRIENIKFKRINQLNNTIGETELTQIIPGLGVTYNAFKNTTVFAGVHRGFAPPTTADIITNNGGIVDLKSELSWNYEIGVRSLPIRGLSLESTFFRTDYENQIVPASVAGGIGATVTNGGRTLHQGLEFAGQIDSANLFNTNYNVYFRTAYTYLGTAEFRGDRFSSISGFTKISVTGNRLPYAPKNLLTTSIGYSYRNFDTFVESNRIGSQFSFVPMAAIPPMMAPSVPPIAEPVPAPSRALLPSPVLVASLSLNHVSRVWSDIIKLTSSLE